MMGVRWEWDGSMMGIEQPSRMILLINRIDVHITSPTIF